MARFRRLNRVQCACAAARLLFGVLSLAAAPFAPAASEAESCAAGTGIPRQDVLVCTRALVLSTLPAPSVATLHNSRGRALRLIGRPQEALAAHDAALAANPSSAEAYLGRALARLDLGGSEAASVDARAALELNARHAGAWRLLGRLRFLANDDAGAEHALGRALYLNPADAEAHAFRGFILYRQGQFAAAANSFRLARDGHLGYEYLPLWQWLAALESQTGRANAIEHALQVLGPDEWPAPLMRVYIGLHDAAALESSLAASAMGGGETRAAEVAFYLAERDRRLGHLTDARERMSRAARLATKNSVEKAMLSR